MSEETRDLRDRPRELTFQRFRLTVVSGPDQGRGESSTGDELIVGTSPASQLVLTDPTVSRHHFSVQVGPRGARLRDLGSTNGTTLGGFEVESAWVPPGALIGAGRTTLRFDITEGEVREPLSPDVEWGRLIGGSAAMRRLFAQLQKIAHADATVLLEGETGTGKGLIAEALHQAGPRAQKPFVVVDCGAIAPTLIESELFGHERGAFTGATAQRRGAFEAADGGTIFLDEIGELGLELQPKLLRVLEQRVVKPVGATRELPVDVRVVAATNRRLHEEVNRGTFRSDLFYRLNIVRLHVPSLRERAEDVPGLVAHFHRQFADGAEPPPTLVAQLAARDWPGNVRELRAAVERAVLLGDMQDLPPAAAPPGPLDFSVPFRVAKERVVGAWERNYVAELIARHGGNVSAAARAAKMDRNYLREVLRKHGLTASD